MLLLEGLRLLRLRRLEDVRHGVALPLLLLRQLHVRRHEASHVGAEISENVTRTVEEEGERQRARSRELDYGNSHRRCIMRRWEFWEKSWLQFHAT